MTKMKTLTRRGLLAGLLLLAATPAWAQFNGDHVLGDSGVKSGSQPGPGLYTALFFYRYDTNTIKDQDGNTVQPLPGSPGDTTLNAFTPLIWYVSPKKVFGANIGAFVTFPFVNAVIEVPALSFGQKTSTRYTDMLVRPLDLGWHTTRADVVAGFQFYAPTGTYELGGSENNGRGMWAYEPFIGTTVYFDEKKSVSLAGTAYWELHSDKTDTSIKVGQILTLQGGVGKSYLEGGVVLGVAYYAQWKLTGDQLGSFTLPGGGTVTPDLSEIKHDVFGLGPDVTLPIASKSTLFALVNIRYIWEVSAHSKTKGDTLTMTATFPIPSVKLNP